MELLIQLPKTKSFEIEINDKHFHSAYSDISKMFFLTKGEHSITVYAQAPSTSLFGRIVDLTKIFSQKNRELNGKFNLSALINANIVISVCYGNFDCVKFVCDQELLSILHSNETQEVN